MLNLLLPSLFLMLFGFFNLLGIRSSFALTQLVNILVGVIIFIIIQKIGKRFFQTNSKFFYWLFVILLAVTYIVGFEVKGSRRWINLILFNFQASEFFKIFFILFLADYIAKNRKNLENFSFIIKLFGFFLLPTLIIFKQPDLGNALVFAVIFFGVLIFSGVPKKSLFILLILIIVSLPIGWLILKDYQRARFLSFLNPHIDKAGTAYNMIQSIITVGSGKLFGRGLGMGTQSKLYFLPENQTDFAFASLIEQFGFVGGLLVVVIYLVLTYFLLKKAFKYFFQKDEEGNFKFFYVLGFLAFFLFQLFINVGMNLGMLPIAGITLPLISYGGSSIVTWMIGLALMP